MPHELTAANLVWNRATEGGWQSPRPGDLALAALLRAHGLAMNGGVLHACELLTSEKLLEAQREYQYFGLPQVAILLDKAKIALEEGVDLETFEREFDSEYWRCIPDDGELVKRFEEKFSKEPAEFSPL